MSDTVRAATGIAGVATGGGVMSLVSATSVGFGLLTFNTSGVADCVATNSTPNSFPVPEPELVVPMLSPDTVEEMLMSKAAIRSP